MQIRLSWPYQVVRLGCCKGALRYCVSLWVFQFHLVKLPSTNQTPTAPTSSLSGLRLALKMKHPNIQRLVIAASLSACKSSSWCNSHYNNTTCLHLQELRQRLIVEEYRKYRNNTGNVWFGINCHAGSHFCGWIGGWDEIYNMFAPLFKSNLHLHPWLVTSYESLSPSEPQSAPKATSLWLAITPVSRGRPASSFWVVRED